MRQARVVVVSHDGDPHGDAVAKHLSRRGIPWVRLSSTSILTAEVRWHPNEGLFLSWESERWHVDNGSTVWWRRPGIAAAAFEPLEQRLVAEEVGALLPGVLASSNVTWVDAPWNLAKARLKLLQLKTALNLGIAIPETVVSGAPRHAEPLLKQGPIVAKAASSGRGIAPYVDVVPPRELARLEACPTILQNLVAARADLRIVTVGDDSFSWRRTRAVDEPPDWRAVDPKGQQFRLVPSDPTNGDATRIADDLALSFSVQDWLVTDRGPVFLEVNPQGQWLFLDGADELVGGVLGSLLGGGG